MKRFWTPIFLGLCLILPVLSPAQPLEITDCQGRRFRMEPAYDGITVNQRNLRLAWEVLDRIELDCQIPTESGSYPARVFFHSGEVKNMIVRWFYKGQEVGSYSLEASPHSDMRECCAVNGCRIYLPDIRSLRVLSH